LDAVVNMVREHGIELKTYCDSAKHYSRSPISAACEMSSEFDSKIMVNYLLEKDVNPTKEDDIKQTPLFYAAKAGYNDIV